MEFVHLRVHSDGSLLDSTFTPERLLEEAQKLHLETLALTDRDSLLRAVEFFQKAPAFGIRPIMGLELSYFRRKPLRHPHTLLIFAENEKGYANLISLLNSAHLKADGTFPPQVEIEKILKQNEGLCALSGWRESEAGKFVLEDQLEEACLALEELKGAFGERLFLELQWHGEKEEAKLIRELLLLSRKLEIPAAATNDVHYLRPSEDHFYQILNCIRTLTRWGEPHPEKRRTKNRHLRSKSEMERAFAFFPQALHNTLTLAERLQFTFPPYCLRLPHSRREKENVLLRELCLKKLPCFYPHPKTGLALQRLEYELSLIEDMGYAGYFLLVYDLVEEAKRRGIYVLGRGSAASSLVSYLLGITLVDPVEENLLFERFLNPERLEDPPDIDLDIERERREELMEYVRQKYGKENVVHVGALNTFRLPGALREVGKVLGRTKEEIDCFQESLHFKRACTEEGQRWVQNAQALEGLIHHVTTHPSGFVITRKPASEEVPLTVTPEGICTQYDMHALSRLGLLKMDFIGSRNLSLIQKTKKLLNFPWLEEVPLNDEPTWNMVGEGDTIGCFQLESPGMRALLRKLKPRSLGDLTVALSLYRPGPIQGGMVDVFILRHHGAETVTHLHPSLKEILGETHGVILYQEQVMRIACEIGGFTMAEADILRRAMSEKDGVKLNSMEKRFLEGSQAKGVSQEIAEKIYALLEKFAGYGFNKAHSASYAIVAYQTAYFKRNFPREFFSVLLSTEQGYYQPFVYVEEAKRMGVQVRLPDINRSSKECTVEEGGIRLGFSYIKDLGPAQIEEIMRRRPPNGFKNFAEVLRLLHPYLERRAFEALIKAGAMDCFDLTRSTMLASLPYFLQRFRQKNLLLELEEASPSFTLHSYSEESAVHQAWELTGVYLPAHPLEVYGKILNFYLTDLSLRIKELPERSRIKAASLLVLTRWGKTKTGKRIGFLTLEDLSGQWEAMLFSEDLARFAHLLRARSLLLVEGEVQERKGERTVVVKDLKALRVNAKKNFLLSDNYNMRRLRGAPA